MKCPACRGYLFKHRALAIWFCRNAYCPEYDRAKFKRAARVIPESATPPSRVAARSYPLGADEGSAWNT